MTTNQPESWEKEWDDVFGEMAWHADENFSRDAKAFIKERELKAVEGLCEELKKWIDKQTFERRDIDHASVGYFKDTMKALNLYSRDLSKYIDSLLNDWKGR